MGFKTRCLIILAVMGICLLIDQGTKQVALSFLTDSRSYLGGSFRLGLAYNEGAFLSLGASLSEEVRWALFLVGNSLVLLLVLIYAFLGRPSLPLLLGAALLSAGGLGNLLDRALHQGRVVDFINLGIGPVRTGVFNVADMAIMAGVFLLLWESIVTPAPEPRKGRRP